MAPPKLKGLGRGLDALLAANTDDDEEKGELQTLPIDALQPGKYQPRTRMDPGSLEAGRVHQGAGGDAADPGASGGRRSFRNHRR